MMLSEHQHSSMHLRVDQDAARYHVSLVFEGVPTSAYQS
jgi:hypothetical protein